MLLLHSCCSVLMKYFLLSQGHGVCGEQKEELENMKKQHDLLKKMLEQQEQLRALQDRQAALLAMQQNAEQAIAVMDDTGVENTHAPLIPGF